MKPQFSGGDWSKLGGKLSTDSANAAEFRSLGKRQTPNRKPKRAPKITNIRRKIANTQSATPICFQSIRAIVKRIERSGFSLDHVGSMNKRLRLRICAALRA